MTETTETTYCLKCSRLRIVEAVERVERLDDIAHGITAKLLGCQHRASFVGHADRWPVAVSAPYSVRGDRRRSA